MYAFADIMQTFDNVMTFDNVYIIFCILNYYI